MIRPLFLLNEAIGELEEYTDTCGLPDEQQPSALVLTVDPRSHPNNCQARIVGDPDALVQVLLFAARDGNNEAFRTSLVDALPELLSLAHL